MKPFVLLATRAHDQVADEEFDAMLTYGGLTAEQLLRLRLEAEPMPHLDLQDFSGIIVGGSPFNISDDESSKSDTQRRVEDEIATLLDRVVAEDFPFFGACYGVGSLGVHQGGVVDRTFGEPVGAVTVSVTPEGLSDPLLQGVPERFDAFVGHKEAVTVVPDSATVLASGSTCPAQLFRVGHNVYASQFHPELDLPGIISRMRAYQHEGYFDAAELERLIEEVSSANMEFASIVLRNFVDRFKK